MYSLEEAVPYETLRLPIGLGILVSLGHDLQAVGFRQARVLLHEDALRLQHLEHLVQPVAVGDGGPCRLLGPLRPKRLVDPSPQPVEVGLTGREKLFANAISSAPNSPAQT